MINSINAAIDIVAENKSNFVNKESAFTRTRDWPFDINTFHLHSKNHSFPRITKRKLQQEKTTH